MGSPGPRLGSPGPRLWYPGSIGVSRVDWGTADHMISLVKIGVSGVRIGIYGVDWGLRGQDWGLQGQDLGLWDQLGSPFLVCLSCSCEKPMKIKICQQLFLKLGPNNQIFGLIHGLLFGSRKIICLYSEKPKYQILNVFTEKELFNAAISSFLAFGQRTRRGRSSVEHRGEFPFVRPYIPPRWGLLGQYWGLQGHD